MLVWKGLLGTYESYCFFYVLDVVKYVAAVHMVYTPCSVSLMIEDGNGIVRTFGAC